jgi:hypothetical protein
MSEIAPMSIVAAPARLHQTPVNNQSFGGQRHSLATIPAFPTVFVHKTGNKQTRNLESPSENSSQPPKQGYKERSPPQQQQQRPDLSRLMQLQAAGGVQLQPGGLPGLPPGFPGGGLPGLHPGIGGIPTSAASLLAGLPPASSAASALMAAHMGVRLPSGLAAHHDLLKKEEEERERDRERERERDRERERANSSKPPGAMATPGPLSDERNVSWLSAISLSE